MSIFASIVEKIFHPSKASAATQGHFEPTLSGTSIPGQPDLSAKPASTSVDVNALLKEMADKSNQNLNYKESIVDLLKLLDLDSSMNARIALAKELNYTGDTKDSSAMNVWLHKKVMEKLAANGGKLPKDMLH